jgi:beta-aspartyl-peptidase (threonine type)
VDYVVRSIVLHGGAGAWRARPGVEKAIEAVRECTIKGWSVLDKYNSALDAVVEAVKCMEDSGHLNAGYGGAPNLLGERELDAGLMTSTGLLGAVAAVKATKNPILLARIIAEKTPHVLLAGENADKLALLYGLPPLPPAPPHIIERYREALLRVFKEEPQDQYYKSIKSLILENTSLYNYIKSLIDVYGTVGAVAIDDNGVLAAATSTGGVILKLPGRVGDTPIPGAGFYATNNVACSATGIGEHIIRTMPCLRLDIEYELKRDPLIALKEVMSYVNSKVGEGAMGFIAVDRHGNMLYAYNTDAMLISYIKRGEVIVELRPEPKLNVIPSE